MHCPACQLINTEGARFCVGCGTALSSSGTPPSPPPDDAHGTPPPLVADVPPVRVSVIPDKQEVSAGIEYAATAPPHVSTDPDVVAVREALRAGPNALGALGSMANSPHEPTRPPAVYGQTASPGEARATGSPPAPAGGSTQPPGPGTGQDRVLVGFLVTYDGSPLGTAWRIEQGQSLLGRIGSGVAAEFEIGHATVSSRHATIRASAHPSLITLLDHNSTNGTFVNNSPLPPETPQALRDGDRLRFGLFNAIVKII